MFVSLLWTLSLHAQAHYKKTIKLMGSRFDITVVANSPKEASYFQRLAVEEIKRIEAKISSWLPNSETSKINRNAGVAPVVVSKELFSLIERAQALSKLTQGAFDLSYASMDAVWKFDGSLKKFPSAKKIKTALERVGYENIRLNKENQSVFLTKKGMKIGFGAIGKGYAADKAKKCLQSKGLNSGIINASGDLRAWGKQANGDDWIVAITNPLNKKKAFSWLSPNNKAVVTSGNYEKFVTLDGVRYAHIIDPRTGHPCRGISSVTVLANSAEMADALSTALFVMGVATGLDLVNQLKDVDCVFIDDENRMHRSKNIQFNKKSW